jgi:hypothetical protein
MVRQFLKSAYKVKVVATAPTPQQQALPLTDDDCDSDELVDGVTGQCSPECPDGSRPSNGVCSGAASSAAPTPAGATGARALPVPPSMQPISGVCLAGYTLVGGRCVWAVHY